MFLGKRFFLHASFYCLLLKQLPSHFGKKEVPLTITTLSYMTNQFLILTNRDSNERQACGP